MKYFRYYRETEWAKIFTKVLKGTRKIFFQAIYAVVFTYLLRTWKQVV